MTGTAPVSERVLARFGAAGGPGTQLLCLPYAGGGAQVFRGWQERVPAGVEVTGVRLPGREQRFREAPLDTWPEALAELAAAVAPEAARGPYAFFGHSLGARLAYELTHVLTEAGHRPPELLVVAACRAPGRAPRHRTMHDMDGPELLERLREMNGVPPEVLENQQLMRMFEPVLRADLRLAETWEPSPGAIGTPILAMCGERDDIDHYEDMTGWRRHTTGAFAIRSFPAGHFFLRDEEAAVVAEIAAHLPSGPGR